MTTGVTSFSGGKKVKGFQKLPVCTWQGAGWNWHVKVFLLWDLTIISPATSGWEPHSEESVWPLAKVTWILKVGAGVAVSAAGLPPSLHGESRLHSGAVHGQCGPNVWVLLPEEGISRVSWRRVTMRWLTKKSGTFINNHLSFTNTKRWVPTKTRIGPKAFWHI